MRARCYPRLAPLLVLVALFGPLLGPAAPASAAITFVQNLGTGMGIGTSITFMTTSTVMAGHSIIVSIATLDPTATLACSDPINGAYTTDVQTTTNTFRAAICSKHNVLVLPQNSAITINSSVPTEIVASATEFAGLAATGTLDRTAQAASTGTDMFPAVTLGAATAQANELLLGAIGRDNFPTGGTAFVPGTNGTGNACANTSSTTYGPLPAAQQLETVVYPEYCIVAATGTYQAAGSFDTRDFWSAVLATYKEAPPTPTPTSTATTTSTSTSTPTPTPTGMLTPTAMPCILGDINCDGIVDLLDYGAWRQQFGATNCGNVADLNHDCLVDIRDYGIWRANFGHTAGARPRAAPPSAPPTGTATLTPRADRWPASPERGATWGGILQAVQALGSLIPQALLLQVMQ